MIQLNVLSLLEQKGKSKYWLYKQMGMSYQNFNRMVTNQTKSIRLSNIETLCMLLECTPKRPVRHRLGGKRGQRQLTVTFCIMTQNDNLPLSKKDEPQNFSSHYHRKKSTQLFPLGGLSCFFPKSFIFSPPSRHTNPKRENCSTGRRRRL